MNIFILDYSMEKNVQYYCDSHVNKMISEYCQLLSNAIYTSTGKIVKAQNIDMFNSFYPKCVPTINPTHVNHPCSVWTRESMQNFNWLKSLLFVLHDEWKSRFYHTDKHASFYKFIDGYINPILPDIGLTLFPQSMPDKYKNSDVITAYRAYYNGDKRHLFKWTNRETPYWIHR